MDDENCGAVELAVEFPTALFLTLTIAPANAVMGPIVTLVAVSIENYLDLKSSSGPE